jgi:hypothetical protein
VFRRDRQLDSEHRNEVVIDDIARFEQAPVFQPWLSVGWPRVPPSRRRAASNRAGAVLRSVTREWHRRLRDDATLKSSDAAADEVDNRSTWQTMIRQIMATKGTMSVTSNTESMWGLRSPVGVKKLT